MSEIRSQATPARDELVHILAGEIGLEIMEVVVDLTGGYKPDGERDHNRIEKGARAILALLKPRTVNSEAELDGLGELNRLLDRVEAEAEAEFNREHTECTWTAPKSQTIALDIHEIGPELWSLLATGQLDRALLLDSNQLAPPKRPPDPERPFWAVRPDRMRRNAIKPTRRVK